MAKKRAASAWRKSPDDLVALFYAALPDDPRVERRQMSKGSSFRGPCTICRIGTKSRDAERHAVG